MTLGQLSLLAIALLPFICLAFYSEPIVRVEQLEPSWPTDWAGIDWSKSESALPAFLIIAGIPMTFSIAAGIGLGVFGFVAVMGAQNRWREIHPLMYGLVVLFGVYYASDWLSAHVF